MHRPHSSSPTRRERSSPERFLPGIGQAIVTSAGSSTDGRWPAYPRRPRTSSPTSSPRSPRPSRAKPRPFTASPATVTSGPGRATAASKATSIWSLADATMPQFAVGNLECELVHDISVFNRMLFYKQLLEEKRRIDVMRSSSASARVR